MGSEWTHYSLVDIALPGKDGLVDGPFGSNLPSSSYTPTGIPVIRGSNLTKGQQRFKDEEFVYVSPAMADTLSRSFCLPDDIVFTKKGTLGQIGLIPKNRFPVYLLSSNQMRMRVNPKMADPEFVYYCLAQPDSIEKIIRDSEHTGVPKINLAYLKSFPISLPDLETQKSIVSTLRALDDRITLLRETNTTLEAIAQALFKSWFVDFDPVHAKKQGREPEGMDAETAALFPDSFEESELGLVPKGWSRVSFTETVKVIGGGTPKTSMQEYWTGDIPWFSVVDAPASNDVFVIDTAKHISDQGLNSSSTKLLAVGTTIISARGTVGRLALVGREMAMNQSCYGLRGKAEDAYFTYFSTYRLVESLKQRSHGSVFDTITTETMKGVTVVYPNPAAISAFENALDAVMARIKNNLEQAQSLSQLRDTLLPRLISGQLRLPEAETEIAEAVA